MMLSRAAARHVAGVRAISMATSSPITHRALPTVWSRGMAKNNKPQSASRFDTQKQQPSPAPSQKAAPSTASQPPPPAPKQPAEAAPAEPTAESLKINEKKAPAPQEEEEEPIDLSKLPDLTQGIPSTLEYETTGATDKSKVSDVQPEEQSEASTSGGGGKRPKGELPASAYVSSSERKRQKMVFWMLGFVGLAGAGATVYLGRDWDDEELAKNPTIPNGWGLGLWWKRAMARMTSTVTYYQEPAFEKLLPDPDPSFERPYTLCISLEDMLVHSEWTRDHGWRVAKRPGVDYFLHYLSQYYELVLFTTVPFGTAEGLVRKLDPYRFIMWPLFREATKYKDGEIVKDLSYLNRDLSKVIIIDTDPKHVRLQPENAIILPKWKGDPKDKALVDLVPFLEFIHTMQYDDTRKVLKSFEGKDIPVEFARREALARAEHQRRLGAKANKPQGGGLGWLSSHLGLKPSNLSLTVAPEGEENPSEAFAKGKMLQDIARERGMRNYLMLEEEIRKNGEKWLKEEQEMQEKAQKEAMKSMKTSFFGWFVKDEETPAATPAGTEPKKA
ncbi:mitochondrial import inner membrane translocase [Podospora australis]|uniref:Mitochondrial import inner membrane translocase subunit TIM50 n=1 Tax=Podospora australis TaxID=1536484 RepID=A0AAN6WT93_9PEZI|nr:mitochondrial import inner membrane translocase [Podospora australis]